MNNPRLTHLFEKQLKKQISPTEKEELMHLLADYDNEEQAKTLLEAAWEDFEPVTTVFTGTQSERMLQEVIGIVDPVLATKGKSWRIWYKYVSVAAVLIIMLSIGLFFYSNEILVGLGLRDGDIPPGNNTATLTLGNGHKISLADAADGKLAEQSGISITKTKDGQLVYKIASLSNEVNKSLGGEKQSTYNIIETPRGGQHQVILPDGTKVWLNSASSIKFATALSNTKLRKVELIGEAFFEVAKVSVRSKVNGKIIEQRVPFVVTAYKQQLEVLGTHFNISAYKEEQAIETTLLEGSVKVVPLLPSGSKMVKILKPGQQSVISGSSIEIKEGVDLEAVVAWKDGYFNFNESLESIMSEVSRWYNVEVVYETKPDADPFIAKISRTKTLSALLKIIEQTGGVHFKIEGRRVTVTK
jgi:transmembrane sensor